MKTKKINVTRTDNMTVYKRDSIIMKPKTLNLTGEVTSHERRFNRFKSTKTYKIRQVWHYIISIVLLVLVISLWIRANAEEVTLESIIEQEEHTDADIDKFIELLDKEVNEEIDETIFPTEESHKSYEEFMKKWEELHKIKYEEQKVEYIRNELCPNWEALIWCQNVVTYCWALDYPNQFHITYNKCILEEYKIHKEQKKNHIAEDSKMVVEQAFEVITKFEWFHNKPYWDYLQWSCGYGMRCSKDTTGITKEKSKQFVIDRIKSIREKHNLKQYDDNIEVALISFIYNIGHAPVWMDRYIKNNHLNALKGMMRKYSYAWGKYLRWLALRRNYETWLF